MFKFNLIQHFTILYMYTNLYFVFLYLLKGYDSFFQDISIENLIFEYQITVFLSKVLI